MKGHKRWERKLGRWKCGDGKKGQRKREEEANKKVVREKCVEEWREGTIRMRGEGEGEGVRMEGRGGR